jgi:hypothetical protein
MHQSFVDRLAIEASRDIWHVLRHEAAITVANVRKHPYSVITWDGWQFVKQTFHQTEEN